MCEHARVPLHVHAHVSCKGMELCTRARVTVPLSRDRKLRVSAHSWVCLCVYMYTCILEKSQSQGWVMGLGLDLVLELSTDGSVYEDLPVLNSYLRLLGLTC